MDYSPEDGQGWWVGWALALGSTTLNAGKLISKSILGCLIWYGSDIALWLQGAFLHVTMSQRILVMWPAGVRPSLPAERQTSNIHRTTHELNVFLILTHRLSTTCDLVAFSCHRVASNGFSWAVVAFTDSPRLQTGSQRTVRFADNCRLFGGTVDYSEPDSRTWVDAHVCLRHRSYWQWRKQFVVGGRTCRLRLKKIACTVHKQALISSRRKDLIKMIHLQVYIDASSCDQRKKLFILQPFFSTSSQLGLFLRSAASVAPTDATFIFTMMQTG